MANSEMRLCHVLGSFTISVPQGFLRRAILPRILNGIVFRVSKKDFQASLRTSSWSHPSDPHPSTHPFMLTVRGRFRCACLTSVDGPDAADLGGACLLWSMISELGKLYPSTIKEEITS